MNANSSSQEPRPDERSLDRRLTVLETRFDTVLPTLATKADLQELSAKIDVELMRVRVDLMKAIHDQTKWLTGLIVVTILGMIGFSVHISNRLPPAGAMSAHLSQQTPAQFPPSPSIGQP